MHKTKMICWHRCTEGAKEQGSLGTRARKARQWDKKTHALSVTSLGRKFQMKLSYLSSKFSIWQARLGWLWLFQIK
jgi:hypothetical protein